MIAALASFLGTTAFRMIWGELSAFFNKKLDHEQEMARLKAQAEYEAAQHERNLAAIQLQANLGVKTIQVQAQAAIEQAAGEAWKTLSESTSRPIGIWLVDFWNAVIRPGCATWAIVMITLDRMGEIQLDEQSWALCGAALGLYLAQRDLFKRGK